MILIIECVVACLLFTLIMVGGVLKDKTAFLHEYAPEVQKAFLEKNPDYVPKTGSEKTITLVIGKIFMSLLFLSILVGLVYLAGAKTFLTGTLYSYIIWMVVNIYDVFALDMGVFAYWKKVRLPGTEDMDKEYTSNYWKHIKDGFFGIGLGIPICLLCGAILTLIV